MPTEGLEAFGLRGGDSSTKSKLIYAFGGYTHTDFINDYESLQSYVSQPILGSNFITYGAELTAANKLGDRDAYFVRYDQRFYNQSVSLKLLHIDYRYISSGKNLISLDYNAAFQIGHSPYFYFSGGLYFRSSLNSWNQPSWSFLNYNTDDNEYFPELVFGSKINVGAHAYVTLDANNREVFNSQNGDDIAFDISANLISAGNHVTWRLTMSNRFTGLLGGNGDLGEQTFMLGFLAPL